MNSAQLTIEHTELTERVKGMRRELDDVHDILKSTKAELESRKEDIATLRQQSALHGQTLDEHLRRLEKWETRSWWFVTAIIGALFALVAALVKR